MDCLIFAVVSKAIAEKRPEADDEYEDEAEDEYEDDYLGPEERRLLRRRLTASGLPPGQVQEMEEAVRRSEMILRQPPEPQPVCAIELVISCVGVLGFTSGAFVAGWIGWAVFFVGAFILMFCADEFCLDPHKRREEEEEKRAGAEAELARMRAVLERTGNADLLPLHDW